MYYDTSNIYTYSGLYQGIYLYDLIICILILVVNTKVYLNAYQILVYYYHEYIYIYIQNIYILAYKCNS